MAVRGRKREINVEERILDNLSQSEKELGFRDLHSQIGHCSKTTLSNSLKLLVSQNQIIKTKSRKYKINNKKDLLVNVKKLEHLLNNLSRYFPSVSNKKLATLGIRIWNMVFQTEFHPISSQFGNEVIPFSYDVSKSKRNEAIHNFFESKKEISYFEDKMYEIFFSFCSKFSSSLLENVFDDVIYSPLYASVTENQSFYSLASSFHKVLDVRKDDHSIYYGIGFCNILYSIDKKSFTKQNLEEIEKDISKFQTEFLEI